MKIVKEWFTLIGFILLVMLALTSCNVNDRIAKYNGPNKFCTVKKHVSRTDVCAVEKHTLSRAEQRKYKWQ